MMTQAMTPIWDATQGSANALPHMKGEQGMWKRTLWKLYVLVGEGWYCCGEYELERKAKAAELTLKQQGDVTMIRRVSA